MLLKKMRKIIAIGLMFTLITSICFIFPMVSAEDTPLDTELVVFHQDYSTMTELPSNIFTTANVNVPYIANISLNYDPSTSSIQSTKYKGQIGEVNVIGLVPALVTTYNIKFSWDQTYSTWSGASIYLRLSGIQINAQANSAGTSMSLRGQYYNETFSQLTAWTWALGAIEEYNITIIANSITKTANVTCNSETGFFSGDIPWYGSTSDPTREGILGVRGSYEYNPEHMTFMAGVASSGGLGDCTKLWIKEITQTIPGTAKVQAIGSTIHQALGFDGPREPSHVMDGFNLIESYGGKPTIFADVDYLTNETYVQYIKGLIANGWELGIHFTEDLNSIAWEDLFDFIDTDFAAIVDIFNASPRSWTCLHTVGNNTQAAYIYATYGCVWRNFLMPNTLMASASLTNNSFQWYFPASLSGYAGFTVFTHDTDLEPADVNSIDASKFRLWLSALVSNEIKIVGYYDWYMIQTNQVSASYTIEYSKYGMEITANTNGFPAMTLVQNISSTETIIMDQNGKQVPFTTTPEDYILFEAEDDGVYLITTLADYRAMLMSEAYSPLYALLPVVITMMVIAGVIEMVVGIRKKF